MNFFKHAFLFIVLLYQTSCATPPLPSAARCDAVMTCAEVIRNRITKNWTPYGENAESLKALVEIELDEDAKLTSMKIVTSSGSELFDASAARAIIVSSPFPELHALPKDVFERDFRKFSFFFQPESSKD